MFFVFTKIKFCNKTCAKTQKQIVLHHKHKHFFVEHIPKPKHNRVKNHHSL